MMDISIVESLDSGAYNLLVERRKKLWYSFFTAFENVSPDSEDVAITDLPMPLNEVKRTSNTDHANTSNLSVTLNSENSDCSETECDPDDESDADSDGTNEDESSDEGSEDIAQFSDSDDGDDEVRNEHFIHSGAKRILPNDSDGDDTDIDGFSDVSQSSRYDNNEDINNTIECSDHEEDQLENKNLGQSQRKRTFSETELGDDDLDTNPQSKKMNFQLKSVNLYINANEMDFENDSE